LKDIVVLPYNKALVVFNIWIKLDNRIGNFLSRVAEGLAL